MSKRNRSLLLLLPLILGVSYVFAVHGEAPLRSYKRIRLMQWNVENLFDCQHDPEKNDYDYLPDGRLQWTRERLFRKLDRITEVISHVGESDWPTLVGLCEVENDSVMEMLVSRPPLAEQGYRYVISHSPDKRGIDVALLYRPDCFALQYKNEIEVCLPEEPQFSTRNILYAKGLLPSWRSLHILLCHFPSRRGGVMTTSKYRRAAATQLLAAIDSIRQKEPRPLIVVMGDFNSEPSELNSTDMLGCRNVQEYLSSTDTISHSFALINASTLSPQPKDPPGSYLYRSVWSKIDQILYSSFALQDTALRILPQSFRVVAAPIAVEPRSFGSVQIRPRRTYRGSYYHGGVSDHFPVMVEAEMLIPKGGK
ncbi:hypothetical protein PORCRE_86 [Porphyromonas crevioricanis JCM 15906]|uniref:Endonuclease/exonuclease/phosphatase domain-containing protein n=1 Tax=Porphyromonas crevioricanis JCM 15906 TaxID=1305617 RepID=S4NFQ2_9PORP|nr:endonuclease/exonuclease/phosphatase family protein [Porphyromonas crevioricanis]GAD04402.1 hypothetical protein PORCRE_86 [Porphyromonas crevioricanis JCM 15906]SJZ68791.1 Endonuclease/Exonuclease/phosphatase family protein [Porphyromonas crevioricanis]